MPTKTTAFLAISLFILFAALQLRPDDQQQWTATTPVSKVLMELGDNPPLHYVEHPSEEQIQQGKDLVHKGHTFIDGKRTRQQSRHFVCTHCHNVLPEDPVANVSDPEARLQHAIKTGLPFLQGTTLYGAVNRSTWYNDDYLKKYGSLVAPARDTLVNAIQLCAIECSQGRLLKPQELDAVLAYLWSIELKLHDLDLSTEEMTQLNAQKEDPQKMIQWLKSKYLQASPAHFESPYTSFESSKKLTGRPDMGKAVYELSCQHCHGIGKNVTNLILDDSPLTFKMLKRNFHKMEKHLSIYNITRRGTYAVMGYRPYMPHYPLERLSEQQLTDLRTYIEQEATK